VNCPSCGAVLLPGALFCVECGRSTPVPGHAGASSAIPRPPQAPTPPAPTPAASAVLAPHCPQCGAPALVGDIFCGECGFVLPAGAPSDAEPAVAEPVPPVPEPTDEEDADDDAESTRIVVRRPVGERFVLQFSTGESVVVSGTGLIGRNPKPEPGEFVDQLVTIFDVGKSVSKAHIEFGQDEGRFWVSDRYSTNGTMIRQPDAEPVRCDPGKRYRVERGGRVEIGEQFFIVS